MEKVSELTVEITMKFIKDCSPLTRDRIEEHRGAPVKRRAHVVDALLRAFPRPSMISISPVKRGISIKGGTKRTKERAGVEGKKMRRKRDAPYVLSRGSIQIAARASHPWAALQRL
jgi:hypothetical protein